MLLAQALPGPTPLESTLLDVAIMVGLLVTLFLVIRSLRNRRR